MLSIYLLTVLLWHEYYSGAGVIAYRVIVLEERVYAYDSLYWLQEWRWIETLFLGTSDHKEGTLSFIEESVIFTVLYVTCKFYNLLNFIWIFTELAKQRGCYSFVVSSVTASGFTFSWECVQNDPYVNIDPTITFRVSYYLTLKDECTVDDDLLLKEKFTDWGQWNRSTASPNTYSYSADVSGLYPHSAYNVKLYYRDTNGNEVHLFFDKVQTAEAGMC